jgi:hypothetical protein
MHCSSEQHGRSIPISRGLVLGCRIAYFAERRLPPELQFTAFFLGYQGIQSLWDCPEGIWKVPNQLDFQGHSTDTVDVHSTPLLWYQRLTDHLPTFWDIITPITHLNFQMELQKTPCSLRRKKNACGSMSVFRSLAPKKFLYPEPYPTPIICPELYRGRIIELLQESLSTQSDQSGGCFNPYRLVHFDLSLGWK